MSTYISKSSQNSYIDCSTFYGKKPKYSFLCTRGPKRCAAEDAWKINAVFDLMLSCVLTRLCLQQSEDMPSGGGGRSEGKGKQNMEILIFY